MIHAYQRKLRDWVTCSLLLHKTHTHPICFLPSLSLSVLKNKCPAGGLRLCPRDSVAVFMFECPFERHRGVCLGRQRPKAGFWLQQGAVLSWCAIWSGHTASPHRQANDSTLVHCGCRHICGRCGVPLRTTGTRCYVWHVCQLCICASLASFLYLIPPFVPPELSLLLSLQVAGFAPYRTVCLTEVSQKVWSCFSLQILLIMLILFLLGGGWVTGCPW